MTTAQEVIWISQYGIPNATVLALALAFKLLLRCVFQNSLIRILDNWDSYIVISRPLLWKSTVSFSSWPETLPPAFISDKEKELEGLKQTAEPSKNFIRGCWGCQGCWFTVFLLSSLTSQRPKHSVGYKQKEFLRAAKVVIKWLLYYSGIRSDERKRR